MDRQWILYQAHETMRGAGVVMTMAVTLAACASATNWPYRLIRWYLKWRSE